ncbi:uncharacterized protein A4U43_C07F23070 [Asparagus officinalis]|uniref:Uncharacterized protein n=1 Tax=Asparagus officinalis TaxID=4686 RepID=A0A5P1EEI4_ASPOF|nr:uncharacterized protein A4U43_C07F23070 [Asparagus officinalis]
MTAEIGLRHNHFSHDRTHDPEVTYVFDGNILLFLDGSSHERIEVIHMRSYKTLREIITDAKLSVPHEDVLVKPHFLFRDGVPGGNSLFHYGRNIAKIGLRHNHFSYDRTHDPEVTYVFDGNILLFLNGSSHERIEHLAVPCLMRFNLTNKVDSVKIGTLKYGGGFCQEGLYETSIIGLHPVCIGLPDGKETIPLDDKEEQVDYGHDDNDAYLIEPEDAENSSDVGGSDNDSDFTAMSEAMLAPFPMSSGFELNTSFEGASGVLASAHGFEMTEALAPMLASLVQQRLVIYGDFDDDDDISISLVPVRVEREEPSGPKPSCDEGPSIDAATLSKPEAHLDAAQHQNKGLELDLAKLTKKWDSQVTELQAEIERLSITRSQVILVDPRVLRKQDQKGAHEVRDARMGECVA